MNEKETINEQDYDSIMELKREKEKKKVGVIKFTFIVKFFFFIFN